MTNETLELFRTRRTVRKFTDEDVGEDVVEQLLDVASLAPSRLDRRPLHYLVIRDAELKERIAETLRVRPYIKRAPVLIGVAADPVESPTWEMDGSAAIENMLLAATALGLGGVWIGPRHNQLWDQTTRLLHEAAGLPENIQVVSLVSFGHPAEERRHYEPGEKVDRHRIHYDHWDKLKL